MRMLLMRSTALALPLGMLLVAANCDDGRTELSGGEVLSDTTVYRAVDYPLTSENYKRWLRTQSALDSVGVDQRLRIDARQATEEDIDRVVESLESQPKARAAIESADWSARDYVLTTVALAQSWDAVNRPSVRFTGLRSENVEFLRRQSIEDTAVRTRPRAVFLDNSDTDSEDSDRKPKRKKGGKDSDSDS
jgi:hypothetical protein